MIALIEHAALALSLAANFALIVYLAHLFRIFDPAPVIKHRDEDLGGWIHEDVAIRAPKEDAHDRAD
jgi:hypothetical protein